MMCYRVNNTKHWLNLYCKVYSSETSARSEFCENIQVQARKDTVNLHNYPTI